jgi:hypothetical protein
MESQLKAVRAELGQGEGPDVLDKDSTTKASGGEQDQYGEDAATTDELITPWNRFVAR